MNAIKIKKMINQENIARSGPKSHQSRPPLAFFLAKRINAKNTPIKYTIRTALIITISYKFVQLPTVHLGKLDSEDSL